MSGLQGTAALQSLPVDCLTRCLSYCAIADVQSVAACCKGLREALKDDLLWCQLAEQKWGRLVRELARVQPGGWRAWTLHRLSACSHAISPLDLVQEHYQHCPFQHLVACVLCSRTTGGPVVRAAIRSFLTLHPTPSAVLDAPEDSLLEVIRPLGLPSGRLAAVQGLATGFLGADWEDPAEFKHCGQFVSDSYWIFCRGRTEAAGVADRNLQRYLRWRAHGSVEEPLQQKRGSGSGARKRKAEPPAEAGTLRSGRQRGTSGAPPTRERRQTRASRAADTAAAHEGKAQKGRRRG